MSARHDDPPDGHFTERREFADISYQDRQRSARPRGRWMPDLRVTFCDSLAYQNQAIENTALNISTHSDFDCGDCLIHSRPWSGMSILAHEEWITRLGDQWRHFTTEAAAIDHITAVRLAEMVAASNDTPAAKLAILLQASKLDKEHA